MSPFFNLSLVMSCNNSCVPTDTAPVLAATVSLTNIVPLPKSKYKPSATSATPSF